MGRRASEIGIGEVFTLLTVVGPVATPTTKHKIWSCKCACGATVTARAAHLTSGHKRSCGCLHRQQQVANLAKNPRHTPTPHRMSRTPAYISWAGMHQRCRGRSEQDRRIYVARGISVHPRWRAFEAFLADMGERPPGKTLDRINNEGNYEPGNCRWATPKEQWANSRRAGARP